MNEDMFHSLPFYLWRAFNSVDLYTDTSSNVWYIHCEHTDEVVGTVFPDFNALDAWIDGYKTGCKRDPERRARLQAEFEARYGSQIP